MWVVSACIRCGECYSKGFEDFTVVEDPEVYRGCDQEGFGRLKYVLMAVRIDAPATFGLNCLKGANISYG